MRQATLLSFVLLCLLGAGTPVLAGQIARVTPAAPASRPSAPPADEDDEQAPAAARGGQPQPSARGSERRRRSYASCNRDSHKRNLRGGNRRRFLIRCKLGYERRQPASQPPRQGEPVPPGKRL